MSLTDHLVSLAQLPSEALSARALTLARFSLLDWIACGCAGRDEPVAAALRALAAEERGVEVASLFGGGRAPARMAALVNGATSHALDYDDTHFAHVGHLSVGVYPAALALAEQTGASARELVEAFVVGAEGAIRTGLVLGQAHYDLGFHQTATAGAFGATLAASRLLGLDARQVRAALGLCATRASGLKSQFGTMGKPYNAGLAASNGVECARLAALGMNSADDGLMGLQGFVETHTPHAHPGAGQDHPAPGTFLFEANSYKMHACCHGTHAMIEALCDLARERGLALSDVATIHLRTSPRWLRVCDIKRPRTGLEIKFSYAWLAGMALRGDATGSDRTYTDALAGDPALAAFAGGVTVEGDPSVGDMQARLSLGLADGTRLEAFHDLSAPIEDGVLAAKLRAKAVAILGARGDSIWELLPRLAELGARDLGSVLRGEP